MAVTKVYKETNGFNLVLEVGSDPLIIIGYPLLSIQGTNVRIKNGINEMSHFIPVADVSDSANAAIGGQTEDEVRIYTDAEMKK